MNHGDILVKKERSGKVLSVEGRKADEYTEKYEIAAQAIKSAEEILRENKLCSSPRIADLNAGGLALNDMTNSEFKNSALKRIKDAVRRCKEDENGVCNYPKKK
jgi:hypothetical protein